MADGKQGEEGKQGGGAKLARGLSGSIQGCQPTRAWHLLEPGPGPLTPATQRRLKNRVLSSQALRELEHEDVVFRSHNSTSDATVNELLAADEAERTSGTDASLLAELLDVSPLLQDAGAAIVDDSFLRCFKSASSDPWNWNIYLWPLWAVGVLVRYCLLFPLRLLLLTVGFLCFFLGFAIVHNLFPKSKQPYWERLLVQFQCQLFVASWTGVVRYHGPRPVARPHHVWVSNHTSMIDYIILTAHTPFAVIMQLHPGWVGFLQTRFLNCLGCLWFNRTEVKDRQVVAERMRRHVQDPASTPLLIFPEGTCVNNEYCVMFKRGAFDLGATVCPVAIKYNKVFVDAFWNSKRMSFTSHLGRLMVSWAVVCDVHFLEPQSRGPQESAQAFAERVQRLIAERAKLTVAPWDGYLKYYSLGAKHPDLIEKRRKLFADRILRHLERTSSQRADSHSLQNIAEEG